MSETQIGKETPKKVPPEMVKKSLVGQVGSVALIVGILLGWILSPNNEKALMDQNFSLKHKLEVVEGNFGVCTANFSKLVGKIPHIAEINFNPVINEIEKNCGPKKVTSIQHSSKDKVSGNKHHGNNCQKKPCEKYVEIPSGYLAEKPKDICNFRINGKIMATRRASGPVECHNWTDSLAGGLIPIPF